MQNPNNIPTYPVSPRTDPDGHDPVYYFQQAYNIAIQAIGDPGPFGLENTFYDLHVGGNDRGKEMVLYADHTDQSDFYNGSPLSGFDNEQPAPRNTAVWMVTWNYTVINSATNSNGTGGVSAVQREAAQPLGRPYIRMAPPIEFLQTRLLKKHWIPVMTVLSVLFTGVTGLKAGLPMQHFTMQMKCLSPLVNQY
ncbi:MAG: hypothetical protein WDM90_13775 [Ferruginibacter sp.]